MPVSCAATICHFPARLSHVSVQIRQRFVSLPSLALETALSAPYAIAMESGDVESANLGRDRSEGEDHD